MTFEAGWNAAIEKAAEVIGELEARFHELTNEALSLKQDNRASRCGSVAHEMNRALRAIRSLTLPSDLMAVLREPTPEMVEAAVEADDKRTGAETCKHIYRAMLAAHKEGQ